MRSHSALARCGILTGVVAGLVVVLLGPAWLLAQANGVIGLLLAALLCLAPGLLVFFLTPWFAETDAPVVGVLAATSLRLMFVLIGTIVLRVTLPQLGLREFIVWLVVFYLATLMVETLLTVRESGKSRP